MRTRKGAALLVSALTLMQFCPGDAHRVDKAPIPDADRPRAAPPRPSPTERPPAWLPGYAPAPTTRPDFPSDGLPPLISSIPTGARTVFLTIDDGWEKDPAFIEDVRRWQIPITVFLTRDAVEGKWSYFRDLKSAGANMANHTLTHPNLGLRTQDDQRREICGMSETMNRELGERPTLFRPPFGSYNSSTRAAARSCGATAILLWKASSQNGGKIAYQDPQHLVDGDIILIHFRPGLARDFRNLLRRIRRQGFQLGDLNHYLPPSAERLPKPL